jgi:hypothetical protein
MPDPRSLIGTYPPEGFDTFISKINPKQICVFIDLKNIMTALFLDNVCQDMINISKNNTKLDSSIFQSILTYSAYWKNFSRKRNMPVKIFFSTDIGTSSYHLNIDKNYKINRVISTSTSPAASEFIKEIRDKNFLLAEDICNKIPHVHFFCLKYLESDFLPYYLLTRKLQHLTDTLFIVCSSDKDLLQTLIKPEVVMINKKKGVRYMVDYNSAIVNYLQLNKSSTESQMKKSELLNSFNPNDIAMLMAVTGDKGDDVPGVDNIGPIRAAQLFCNKDVFKNLVGSLVELNERVDSGGKFFLEDKIGISQLPKPWQKVFLENDKITRAYKLISFEMLSRWLEKVDGLDKIKQRDYIDKILYKQGDSTISDPKQLFESLSNLEDLYLEYRDIEVLFSPVYKK